MNKNKILNINQNGVGTNERIQFLQVVAIHLKIKLIPLHTLIKYLHTLPTKTLHTSFLNILFDIQQPILLLPQVNQKGGLFVSAKAEIKKITNIGNSGNTNHIFFCAKTISFKFKDPTHKSTLIIITPIETS